MTQNKQKALFSLWYQPALKTPPTSFLLSPPLNQQTVCAPSFLGNPPIYLLFVPPPPPLLKSQIFQ